MEENQLNNDSGNNTNSTSFNSNNSSQATKSQKFLKFSIKEIFLIIVFTIVFTLGFTFIFSIPRYVYNQTSETIRSGVKKPIIYLYPTNETQISIQLGKPENLTCSYPKYEGSWNVLAKPNGDLVELETGRNLYSLYWEGISNSSNQFTEGFCVKGEDSAKFLEDKLAVLGLSDREAEEFIVYWLPKLEANKYNLIEFESLEEINQAMPLNISPTPDSVIRVMMKFKGIDSFINIPKQQLFTPQRTGFVVVEWGGTEIK